MRSATRPFLSGIILAAGASSRMGRLKQLLPLQGRPLLQHVVDAAVASCLDEILLVIGHRAEEIRAAINCADRVRTIVNTEYAAGQSTSLRAGLRAAHPSAAAAAVLLGDQPGVTAPLIDKIAAAFLHETAPGTRSARPLPVGSPCGTVTQRDSGAACSQSRAPTAPVVRPVYDGPGGRRVPGHPVFLARRVWPDAEELRGNHGARALLTEHPEWLFEVPVEGDAPCDIDTWEEYQSSVGAAPPPSNQEGES